MLVSLQDLAYPDEFSLFKMILSSADRFPGLYRISSTWEQALHEEIYLKVFPFLEVCHQTEKGSYWHRDEWFKAHYRIFDLAYGKGSRNEERSDQDLKMFLKEKGYDWFNRPQSFAMAVIDNITEVHEISLNSTYYMMGSLIRFEKDRFLVSFDAFSGEFSLALNIDFETARNYVETVFSKESLSSLFLQAEIIAHLKFDEEGEGELMFHNHQIDKLLERFPGNCPIFAAPNYSEILPIRFAKLIGVSNVLR